MDRRRFVPSAEGLDARVLLSAGGVRALNVPVSNIHQRTVRIERLPVVLGSLQPNRRIPAEIVEGLQSDLRALVGKLQPPARATLTAMQLQFRTTIANASVSAEDAAALRARFRGVLESGQAPQAIVENMVARMDALVKVVSTGPNGAKLAANDYAVVLQTALGVGRPIRTPAPPKLSSLDDDRPKNDRATTVTQPHIVGRYDASTTIQLLDESGRLIGQAPVDASGQYSVAPVAPLSVGRHVLTVRAVDLNGNTSATSAPLTIRILAPKTTAKPVTTTTGTPSGPLGF